MEQLIYVLLVFLGVICHCLMKAMDLQKDAKAANMAFSFKDYIKSDWIGISLSFVVGLAWIFLFGEVAQKFTQIEDFVRTSFFVMGLMGSYVVQKFASRGKKTIRNIVDEKTNKADAQE